MPAATYPSQVPVDDVGAERECENDRELDHRVEEAGDEP